MRTRPYLTGGYLRPSYFNRPLPRMRNQPTDITMMISKRIKARARRQTTMSYCKGIKEDLRLECWFEARLRDEFAKSSLGNSWEPVFGDIKSWRKLYSQIVTILREKDSQIATIFFPTDSVQPIQQHEKRMNASFMIDNKL